MHVLKLNKVTVDVSVFCPFIKDIILSNLKCTFIITVNRSSSIQG